MTNGRAAASLLESSFIHTSAFESRFDVVIVDMDGRVDSLSESKVNMNQASKATAGNNVATANFQINVLCRMNIKVPKFRPPLVHLVYINVKIISKPFPSLCGGHERNSPRTVALLRPVKYIAKQSGPRPRPSSMFRQWRPRPDARRVDDARRLARCFLQSFISLPSFRCRTCSSS